MYSTREAIGVQPTSSVVLAADVAAAVTTANLAATVPPSTLAATASPTGEVQYSSAAGALPAHLAKLREQANAACFGPTPNPVMCSELNQVLASLAAQRTSCPGGVTYRQLDEARKAGSWEFEQYFYYPTYSPAVNVSNADASGVAVTATAARSRPAPVSIA